MTLISLTSDGITPDVARPDPSKIVAGDPVHTVWTLEERDGLYCGLWHSTTGAWRVAYAEWEYCHLRAGVSVLTDEKDHALTYQVGDSFIIRPGFTGIWTVIEPVLKDDVILLR